MAQTSPALVTAIKNELVVTRPSFDQMNLNNLNFQKELEFAIQIFERNDYLAKMSMPSIKNALVNIALSGLTLNPVMKMAYLVPRKGQCCVDPSYMGLVKILTDSGSVKSIKSDVVYEKDTFDIDLGSNGYLKHKPYLGADARGRKIGAYSVAILSEGMPHIDFMRWDDIMSIKSRSEAVRGGKGSPWDTDEDEMACKTVIKRHWKYLPKSERAVMAANAISLDNQINGIDFEKEQSTMGVTTSDTIDATYEDISINEIPEEIINAVKDADTISELKEIWGGQKELHALPNFKQLVNKRKADLELSAMQQKFGTDGK